MPLAERDDWKDLKIIPQDDGPNPLVPIMYSEECEWFALAVTLGCSLL